MSEIRVQVAYHFKIDPAKLPPGPVRLPEQITRTVSAGDEFDTQKVALAALAPEDQAALAAEIEKQVREQTRTARPAGAVADPSAEALAKAEDEMSAF